jgi:serine/threonine-protein kinase/endoribonuclease IRE1
VKFSPSEKFKNIYFFLFDQAKSSDIFSLGCVYYYTLSQGHHPFGSVYDRQSNIIANKFDLSALNDDNYENIFARELISDMLQENLSRRPVSDAVLRHPIFWGAGKLLDFLQNISDRVERLNTNQEPLWTLERNARFIVKDDWKSQLDVEIINDLGRQRTYHSISVRDLLRAMRNKRNHYMELSDEVKDIFGTIPIDYANYWLNKFPYLPSHAYHVMQMCAKEPTFAKFYVRYFTFTKPDYLSNHNLDNYELLGLVQKLKDEINDQKYYNRVGNKRGSYNFKHNKKPKCDN